MLDMTKSHSNFKFIRGELENIKRIAIKCWPEYFIAILKGQKTFEIRKNDRNYKVGDVLLIQEWDPVDKQYTKAEILADIVYITDYAQEEGYVVIGMANIRRIS